ncbi:MAG: polysaccharide pyruvyl transferase family protein [Clostridia bacterium]|nr:polysaccharide pyruvyl transferase family protein [Clostridia bacterium]
MLRYGLAWRPSSDNLGSDLLALAAMRLLPQVDHLLDADALDAPIPGLQDDDRIVTLIPGPMLASSAHWPPEKHVAPVCVGVHISSEDAWGLSLATLDGAGLASLRACAPIGCRDQRTAARLERLGIPHILTACLTLTLDAPHVHTRSGIVCCDVPEAAISVLREYRRDVTVVTHHLEAPSPDFSLRMAAAQAMLDRYAGAEMVFTRRLHCAMACLAVGTPVLLLYNDQYEDVSRFAPMNSMFRSQPLDEFVQQVSRRGLPSLWRNPSGMTAVRKNLLAAVAAGIQRALSMPLPIVPEQEAALWRSLRVRRMIDSAAVKIRNLENQHYEDLHEKFSLLLREDSAKATLTELLSLPDVRKGLRRADLRRKLAQLPVPQRIAACWKSLRGSFQADGYIRDAKEALDLLGWPENREEH